MQTVPCSIFLFKRVILLAGMDSRLSECHARLEAFDASNNEVMEHLCWRVPVAQAVPNKWHLVREAPFHDLHDALSTCFPEDRHQDHGLHVDLQNWFAKHLSIWSDKYRHAGDQQKQSCTEHKHSCMCIWIIVSFAYMYDGRDSETHLDKRFATEGCPKELPEGHLEMAAADAAQIKERIWPSSQQEDAPETVPETGTTQELWSCRVVCSLEVRTIGILCAAIVRLPSGDAARLRCFRRCRHDHHSGSSTRWR